MLTWGRHISFLNGDCSISDRSSLLDKDSPSQGQHHGRGKVDTRLCFMPTWRPMPAHPEAGQHLSKGSILAHRLTARSKVALPLVLKLQSQCCVLQMCCEARLHNLESKQQWWGGLHRPEHHTWIPGHWQTQRKHQAMPVHGEGGGRAWGRRVEGGWVGQGWDRPGRGWDQWRPSPLNPNPSPWLERASPIFTS